MSQVVGPPAMAEPRTLPPAPITIATAIETTPMPTAQMPLASTTRPRCGTRVNVVSPLRWLHSLVTDRSAIIGSTTDIGNPIAAAKVA